MRIGFDCCFHKYMYMFLQRRFSTVASSQHDKYEVEQLVLFVIRPFLSLIENRPKRPDGNITDQCRMRQSVALHFPSKVNFSKFNFCSALQTACLDQFDVIQLKPLTLISKVHLSQFIQTWSIEIIIMLCIQLDLIKMSAVFEKQAQFCATENRSNKYMDNHIMYIIYIIHIHISTFKYTKIYSIDSREVEIIRGDNICHSYRLSGQSSFVQNGTTPLLPLLLTPCPPRLRPRPLPPPLLLLLFPTLLPPLPFLLILLLLRLLLLLHLSLLPVHLGPKYSNRVHQPTL